jgi:hypothetical protein
MVWTMETTDRDSRYLIMDKDRLVGSVWKVGVEGNYRVIIPWSGPTGNIMHCGATLDEAQAFIKGGEAGAAGSSIKQ